MNAIIVQNDISLIMSEAETLVKSGFLPKSVTTAQQAFAIITMGRELGIGTWAALNGINVIQGKPTISPQLMLGLINRSGQLDNMAVNGDAQSCTVTGNRKGRGQHTETFTLHDASAMGLSGKDNWKKQPAVMLKWRAISAWCRVVFPDVIIGFYTPEEINPDVPIDYETGEILDNGPDILPATTGATVQDIPADTKPTHTVPLAGAPSQQKGNGGVSDVRSTDDLFVWFMDTILHNQQIEGGSQIISADTAKLLVKVWNNTLNGVVPENMRHEVARLLCNLESLTSFKEFTNAESSAISDWLGRDTRSMKRCRAEAEGVVEYLKAEQKAQGEGSEAA